MPPTPPADRLRLTLRPLPHPVPVGVRVRRFLKTLKRAYGLACERIEVVKAGERAAG